MVAEISHPYVVVAGADDAASRSYDGLANTLAHLHHYPESNETHATATKLEPTNALHWANWATHLNDQQKFDEAIEKCERATQLDKRNASAWCTWGMALEAQGKLPGALDKYKKGLALLPYNVWFQKHIANLEQKLAK